MAWGGTTTGAASRSAQARNSEWWFHLVLKYLRRNIGVTTIYATRDQSEALEMLDTIALMNRDAD